MCHNIRVDLVAPPFAGHLFPLLQLASGLRDRGFMNLRVLTAGSAERFVQASGLAFVDLLPGQSDAVIAVANTTTQVGTNPLRLYRQFRRALALLAASHASARQVWVSSRPDLVIADFAVPSVGLLAQAEGIPWWTSMPSPCVMESETGPPAYFGGLAPRDGIWGGMRDAAARSAVRTFKRSVFMLAKRTLQGLGMPSVYRDDGTEAVYSPHRILALGLEPLEFPRTWPAAVRFIGPLTRCPFLPHDAPQFEAGRPCVLVTLGTHLPWARATALELFVQVARAMPDWLFHFSRGNPEAGCDTNVAMAAGGDVAIPTNLHVHNFVAYHQHLSRYAAVVHHGGTGVVYSSIEAGVPALVWPHDYDQFDFAARLEFHGLARRLTPRAEAIVTDLRAVASNGRMRARLASFQTLARAADPIGAVAAEVSRLSLSHLSSSMPG